MRIFNIITVLLLLAGIAAALCWSPGEQVLGSYATSLQGRTRGQRMNALRAAQAVDGVSIESGHTFSFNRTVGSWSADRGYVLAPVSYDGELIVDWGGGVCQASTTLYNAALIAGLEIVERHRHAWAPGYVSPGRDAAVAQLNIDLRFRNPYSYPVRLHLVTRGDSLGFEVLGREQGPMAGVTSEVLASLPPTEVVKRDADFAPGERRIITRGQPGMRVAVYRTLRGSDERELISRDIYPAMSRLVAVGE